MSQTYDVAPAAASPAAGPAAPSPATDGGGGGADPGAVDDMPAFSVVWREFVMLSKLLTEWAPRPGFQSWNRATSSTVIMKTVFTDARFYSCCKNYLYLWTHMATKSMCEAVVEGMGGVWDRCDRQGNWVTATEEAVIAWNAPQPYHPVAVPFINRALENWGGLNWEDRFHHNDRSRAQRGGIGASLQQGVVMSRKKAETHSVCQTRATTTSGQL